MLAYDWSYMDIMELVLLGEQRTKEYQKLINSASGQESQTDSGRRKV